MSINNNLQLQNAGTNQRWNIEDSIRLIDIAATHGFQKWKKIHKSFGETHSYYAVYHHYCALKRSSRLQDKIRAKLQREVPTNESRNQLKINVWATLNTWQEDNPPKLNNEPEVEVLLESIEDDDLNLLLLEPDNRIAKRTQHRWTKEEDTRLMDIINSQQGNLKFTKISKIFNQSNSGLQRNRKSCRQRWVEKLNPVLNHSDLTDEEIGQIEELAKENYPKNKWKIIAEKLGTNRAPRKIQNYFILKDRTRKDDQAL